MCDVPSIAAFCVQSTECFPGMVSKFFFKPCTILEASIIASIIIHFMFHIHCNINSCILAFFPFLLHTSVHGYCHIYQHACFLFFVFNYYIWPICCLLLLFNFMLCFSSLFFVVLISLPSRFVQLFSARTGTRCVTGHQAVTLACKQM